MRLLLMGPPGSGKGTQAVRLGAHFGVPAKSTGEMFRSHLSRGTSLGAEVKEYLAAGDFVPDYITTALVRDRLQQPDAAHGFVLDGYPRTGRQVSELDTILKSSGTFLEIEPVIGHYSSRGILLSIDGSQDVPSVTSCAINILTAPNGPNRHQEPILSQNTEVST